MRECEFGKATVRIHGIPNRERLEAATLKFLKAAEIQKRKVRNEERKTPDKKSVHFHQGKGA